MIGIVTRLLWKAWLDSGFGLVSKIIGIVGSKCCLKCEKLKGEMKKASWAICGPCRQKRKKEKVQALPQKKENRKVGLGESFSVDQVSLGRDGEKRNSCSKQALGFIAREILHRIARCNERTTTALYIKNITVARDLNRNCRWKYCLCWLKSQPRSAAGAKPASQPSTIGTT